MVFFGCVRRSLPETAPAFSRSAISILFGYIETSTWQYNKYLRVCRTHPSFSTFFPFQEPLIVYEFLYTKEMPSGKNVSIFSAQKVASKWSRIFGLSSHRTLKLGARRSLQGWQYLSSWLEESLPNSHESKHLKTYLQYLSGDENNRVFSKASAGCWV